MIAVYGIMTMFFIFHYCKQRPDLGMKFVLIMVAIWPLYVIGRMTSAYFDVVIGDRKWW